MIHRVDTDRAHAATGGVGFANAILPGVAAHPGREAGRGCEGVDLIPGRGGERLGGTGPLFGDVEEVVVGVWNKLVLTGTRDHAAQDDRSIDIAGHEVVVNGRLMFGDDHAEIRVVPVVVDAFVPVDVDGEFHLRKASGRAHRVGIPGSGGGQLRSDIDIVERPDMTTSAKVIEGTHIKFIARPDRGHEEGVGLLGDRSPEGAHLGRVGGILDVDTGVFSVSGWSGPGVVDEVGRALRILGKVERPGVAIDLDREGEVIGKDLSRRRISRAIEYGGEGEAGQ